MTTKEKAPNEELFDLRVIERNLRDGKIDPKEYEGYLKKLPDEAEHAAYIDVYEEPKPEDLTPLVDEPTFTSA